jgi:hypothetical protein|tara:strand:- start:212 stop:397 length:186 start_codon:yes stop_codon:yes gene_type:complete
MKIAIKHTVTLEGHELEEFECLYDLEKKEGETFREWYISRFIADGEACLNESKNNLISGGL